MISQDNIDNDGVGGKPLLRFRVDESKGGGFTQEDIDRNLTACTISGNNEVSKGFGGDQLFGRIMWLPYRPDNSDMVCLVQSRGLVRIGYTSPVPVLNQLVEVDGHGGVRRITKTNKLITSGRHYMRGHVVAVDRDNKTCDIWLG